MNGVGPEIKLVSGGQPKDCRQCLVKGKRAFFHRWVDVSDVIPAGLTVLNDHPGGVVRDTYALVEYEGGFVEKVPVNRVQFLDGRFAEYGWPPTEEELKCD